MKRLHFLIGLLTSGMLLSACQSYPSNASNAVSAPPHTFCEENMAWSAEITTDDLVHYTTFWIAFDAAMVQDDFRNIHVDVTLDGQSVADEMKYMTAPEPYSVTCTDSGQQFEASRVQYTLILPQLSSEEHSIIWKYTMAADPADDVFAYPHETTAAYKITLNAENYAFQK